MSKSIPYTYLLGWTKTNMWYYGVRYREKANPNELWNTYFTSSKHVKKYREIFGDPDVIQIRKVFDSKQKALLWENKVLRRLKVVKKTYFLNRTDNKAICPERSRYGASKKKSEKMKNKLKKYYEEHGGHNKGKKASSETKEKMSASRTGLIIINNGEIEKRIRKGEEIPNGFTKGRLRGKITINDGINIKRIDKNEEIPPGYVRGGLKASNKTKEKMSKAHRGRTPHNKNKRFYNNGIEEKLIPLGEKIPDGFVKGVIDKKKFRPENSL